MRLYLTYFSKYDIICRMENKSILDTIIDNTIKEEAAVLDSSVILENFFSALREKERDVLVSRFGLEKNRRVTLEAIGKQYQLTRERIRQIETSAIAKIKKHEQFAEYVASLKHIVTSLLEEHGGIMEEQYLIENLSHLSSLAKSEQSVDLDVLRNHYDFVLLKLLADEFDHVKENSHYDNLWKVKFASIEHIREVLEYLLQKLQELERVLTTEEIITLLKESEVYARHEEKFSASNNFDISPVIQNKRYKENYDFINEHKALYSLLRSAKGVEQNKFGQWGLKHWPEVTPKTINHKIYLVMKQTGKPLHFKEIAAHINDIAFDHKKANPATVHNELILDDKYILIGRGIYALKEWGYDNGTVADVVAQVLRETNAPLSKEEIIERVLAKRLVKPATIGLALMNREQFVREENGYTLRTSQA